MPKLKIVCFVLAALIAATGTAIVIKNFGGEDIPEFTAPTEDPNTYLDLTDDIDITDPNADAIKVLFVAHKVLLTGKGFYGVSSGSTTAAGIQQSVSNTRYVVGEFGHKNSFKEMVTKGIVSNAYQLFMWEDNYIYRESKSVQAIDNVTWSNTAQPLAEDVFYSKFGHRSSTLTGYILNEETVVSGQLDSVDNGLYTFRYELDVNEATTFLRREMITNGGLKSEPVFSKCVIYVSIDSNYNIKSLRTDCSYKANVGVINADCSEDITEIIETYEGDLPEMEFYEQYFDAERGDITKETSALDVLLDIFGPYLDGEDLQVALSVSNNGSELANALLSISGLDISDLTKLQVAAKLGDVNVAYHNDSQSIFLKYQDFKGSTTVDGIMGLVDTIGSLVSTDGSSMDTSALDDIDLEALLAELSYTVSDDGTLCTVSLPVSLLGLDINANLYADINGETYTFTQAVITIGDVQLTIVPQKWQVEEIVPGEYPELLGLADLIAEGKLALTANVTLPIGDVDYKVDADLLVDLATLNLSASARLGNNGTAYITFVDGIAYVAFGGLKVKLDTANLDELMQLIDGLVDTEKAPSIEMPDIASMLIGALQSISATQTAPSEVAFSLNVEELQLTLTLRAVNNRWQLHRIAVSGYGIDAVIAPSEAFADVTSPADAQNYADITKVIDTFDDPILAIVNASSYGADFDLDVTLGQKNYVLQGNFALDVNGNVKVVATVFTDNVGIINADVIYANNTVFLTVNGIKVAFAVNPDAGSDSEIDFEQAIDELLANEQIQALLEGHQELAQLIDELQSVVETFTHLDLASIDFSKIVSSMKFEENKLELTVNGSDFGLRPFKLIVANDDGDLRVSIYDFTFASITLNSVSVRVLTDVSEVAIPDTDDYILNLNVTVVINEVAIDVELSADLYSMDIWACAQVNNENILLRYVDSNVYVKYGNIALKLDTNQLGDIIGKIVALTGAEVSDTSTIDIDINAILSSISFNWTAETPCISFDNGDIALSLNFNNVDGILYFGSIALTYSEITATVEQSGKQATLLTIGQDDKFVDGNALVDLLLETIDTFVGADGVQAQLALNLNVNGATYDVVVNINYNGGLYATLKLSDENSVLVVAEIYYVQDTLYLDVNGIRQAIDLSTFATGETGSTDIDSEQLASILAQVKEVLVSLDNEVINSILTALDKIPTSLEELTFSEFVSQLYLEDKTLVVGIDLAQLNLRNFTVSVTLGSQPGVSIDGLSVGLISANIGATVQASKTVVTAPDVSTYFTELKLAVGEEISVTVKLDLYHMSVVGKAVVYGQTVNFKLVDGIVYATYGKADKSNVGVMLNLEDIDTLLEIVSQFVELPELSFGDDVDIVATITELLGKLSLTKQQTEDGYNLVVNYDGIAVSVNFTSDGETAKLSGVDFNVDDTAITAQLVKCEKYPTVEVNGDFVDAIDLASRFVEPITDLMDAKGFSIGIDGSATFGSNVFGLNATVDIGGGNVHVIFSLLYDGVYMIDSGELWIVDDVLYARIGDLKLSVDISSDEEGDAVGNTDGNEQSTIDTVKQTLANVQGYNKYVDQLVELVLKLLDTQLDDVDFEAIVTSLAYQQGKLNLELDGSQFDISKFTVGLGVTNGLTLSIDGLSYKDISLNITEAKVSSNDGHVSLPSAYEDFSTNLYIDLQEYDTQVSSSEHNVIYVNLDLINGVVRARIETTMNTPDGPSTSFLDIMYTFNDKVLKLTNGLGINVSVDINNISDIVESINDIVNEIANAGDQELPDLLGSLGGDVDLKAIVQSLAIRKENGNAIVTLSAFGMNATVTFNRGLSSIVVPVDLIENNLVVSADQKSHTYFDFDSITEYISVDQVFKDYYYGEEGDKDNPRGAIYNLVVTNSWLFEFQSDSEINVTNDDGTTTSYQIAKDSFIAFYYNKTDKENIKARANLTVRKNGGEFLYLDLAFIEGRIYATYDSNKSNKNKNELKATVSLDAIKETIGLLPALIDVVPQIGDLINNAKDAMSNAESKMTLGNVSKILSSVSYNEGVFTLAINGAAIDANNFGKKPIVLQVSQYGDKGLKLDELSLSYSNVSVHLGNLVVTGSPRNEETGEFEYITKHIDSYLTEHGDASAHMNFDSIRELLSAFVITADNTDENGTRSFTIEGLIHATLLGNNADIGITVYVDIDKDNNVYLAVKLTRDASGLLSGAIYADDGGNSYMLLNSKDKTISLYRDSIGSTWCGTCGSFTCTAGKVLGVSRHATKHTKSKTYDTQFSGGDKLPSFRIENMPLSEFTSDTTTMVGYILDVINFGSLIDGQIRGAIGKENTNVYGIEDIFKSYTYTYNESKEQGTFALEADLSPIDSALGVITANITHVGNFDNVGYDEDGNFLDGGVKLTAIDGTANMINIMNATYELTLMEPTSGIAYQYVTQNNYLW